MRKLIYPLALAALAVALVPAATATTSKTVTVSITNTAFVPKTVSINVGDAVKWTNNGTQKQQVVCAKCPFTSPVLNPSGSYAYTFKTGGKFAITDPLHTKIKGSVTVNAANKGVTLKATPTVTKYLQSTKLSGKVSPARSGQHVAILGRECGQTVFSTVTTVTTGNGGAYAVSVTPKMNTVYEAKWNTSTSAAVSVHVRPRIRLAHVSAHKYRVKVKAARSFVGKRVLFQKQRADGTWRTVKRVKLTKVADVGPPPSTTVVTKRTFKSKIRHGKQVRILMKSRQAGPCYIGNHSNVITS